MRKFLKRSSILILCIAPLAMFLLWFANAEVEECAAGKTFDTIEQTPSKKVGLLLGTAKYLRNGYINAYYSYRIDAAEKLYKSGKVKYILISGDNSRKDYDEPSMMKQDLVARGIPEEDIYLDYAGFRTLDSVVRAKKVFGQESITFISQPFHNKRAIYLGEANGLNVIGFNAKRVSARYGFKVKVRERFARVKMLLDVWFGKEPKFLGEPLEIG